MNADMPSTKSRYFCDSSRLDQALTLLAQLARNPNAECSEDFICVYPWPGVLSVFISGSQPYAAMNYDF